jgi:hypothetical protein
MKKTMMLMALLLLVTPAMSAEPPRVDPRTQQAFDEHLQEVVQFYQTNEEKNKFKAGDLVAMLPDAEAKRMHATSFTVKVRQVIDKTNLLLYVHADWSSGVVRYGFPAVKYSDKDCEPFWVQNFNTEGLTDKSVIEEVPVFRCVGTKQYETALGSNTVWVFEPYTIHDFIETWTPPARSTPTTRPVRTWKDTTGTFSVRATFNGLGGSVVSLKKEDGSIIKVPLERLCEGDREYIEELRR